MATASVDLTDPVAARMKESAEWLEAWARRNELPLTQFILSVKQIETVGSAEDLKGVPDEH